jgi:8-oxo-dGTP diphosphatase
VNKTAVVVAAAVVQRGDAYLVTRRLRGTHLEGLWEFPGGKCEAGETHTACLQREILEELGCGAEVREKLLTVAHDYGERVVELHFFTCVLIGDPQALLGQEIRWVAGRDLRELAFPAADEALIQLLAGRTAS